MKRRSMYTVVEETPEVLCIRDVGPWDEHLSVTNDAEEVVRELAPALKDGRRLEYYDSDGHRDQILIKDGKFAGFAPAEVR